MNNDDLKDDYYEFLFKHNNEIIFVLNHEYFPEFGERTIFAKLIKNQNGAEDLAFISENSDLYKQVYTSYVNSMKECLNNDEDK